MHVYFPHIKYKMHVDIFFQCLDSFINGVYKQMFQYIGIKCILLQKFLLQMSKCMLFGPSVLAIYRKTFGMGQT